MADLKSPVHERAGARAETGVLERHEVAELVALFAGRLQDAAGDSVQLHRLIADSALELVPGADGAAVSTVVGRVRPDSPTIADSTVPWRLVDLQHELREGPCVDAMRTKAQVTATDLSSDTRWPRYAPAAAALGVVGQLCTPMDLGTHGMACLSLVDDGSGFDDAAVILARILALHAGIALSSALRHESLTAALTSRGVIGQAKGILVERFKMTDEEAFAALVMISADKNVKLRVVADELCRTGFLDVGPLRRICVPPARAAPVNP